MPRNNNTACPTPSKSMSRSDTTACAALPRPSRGAPAQASNVPDDDPDDDEPDNDPDDDNDPKNKSDADRLEETTACAASPAQALPRGVVRGQNPNHRSLSDRTDCAAFPRPSRGAPAQPAAPQKPKPDADGFI
jgi:hypothetical protein